MMAVEGLGEGMEKVIALFFHEGTVCRWCAQRC